MALEVSHDHGPDRRTFLKLATDKEMVLHFILHPFLRLVVNPVADRVHNNIEEQHADGAEESIEQKATTCQGADGGGTPDGSGGGQAFDCQPVAQNDAASQETHAGHYLPGDTRGAGVMFNKRRQAGKERGTKTNQGVSAQARWVLPPLPFQPNDKAAEKCHSYSTYKIKDIHLSNVTDMARRASSIRTSEKGSVLK